MKQTCCAKLRNRFIGSPWASSNARDLAVSKQDVNRSRRDHRRDQIASTARSRNQTASRDQTRQSHICLGEILLQRNGHLVTVLFVVTVEKASRKRTCKKAFMLKSQDQHYRVAHERPIGINRCRKQSSNCHFADIRFLHDVMSTPLHMLLVNRWRRIR